MRGKWFNHWLKANEECNRLEGEIVFWRERYKVQHRTLHKYEDKIKELRAEVERLTDENIDALREWGQLNDKFNQARADAEALYMAARAYLQSSTTHYRNRLDQALSRYRGGEQG